MTPRRPFSSALLLASMLLLLPTDTRATSKGSVAFKLGLYRVRKSSICAAVINTGSNFSAAERGKTADPGIVFGSADKLPLSECHHQPHDFVIEQHGLYSFLSNMDVLASLFARNYSFTFCVNTEERIDFSCYRVRDRNGEKYFVAPTDYERVLVRGPVGFYKCPQAFDALYDEYSYLIQNESQCATFLTVSGYGVRTDSDQCIRLFRYGAFKNYPEVWNECQRYAEGESGNFYDCRFDAVRNPWNYPTLEEVSRCADSAPRIQCSSVQFNLKADERYFYPGIDVEEMTQNKYDRESCQPFSFDDLDISAGWLGGSHYKRTAAIGGGGIVLAIVVFALRIMCRVYLCGLCRREPAPLAALSLQRASVSSPAQPTPPSAPPPYSSNSTNSANTAFSSPEKLNNAASGAMRGQMRNMFTSPASEVPYERLHAV